MRSARIPSLKDNRGFALGLVLFSVVVLSSLALSLSTTTLATRQRQVHDLGIDRAAFIARAGFERSCAEILLNSDDWSSLGNTAYVDEIFSDGLFSASFENRTTGAVTVVVEASYAGTLRTLEFSVLRESNQQGNNGNNGNNGNGNNGNGNNGNNGNGNNGGGSSTTTGVTLLSISDPTLDILVH